MVTLVNDVNEIQLIFSLAEISMHQYIILQPAAGHQTRLISDKKIQISNIRLIQNENKNHGIASSCNLQQDTRQAQEKDKSCQHIIDTK